jgi:hypothetical protein
LEKFQKKKISKKNFKENCVRFATSHSGRTLLNSVQKNTLSNFGKLCVES